MNIIRQFLKEHWVLALACAIWLIATVTAVANDQPIAAIPCFTVFLVMLALMRDAWRGHLRNEASPVNNLDSVTLTAQQLLEALDFVAPDRDADPEQLECELTIQYGDGHAGRGHYCWLTDYPGEGSHPLFDAREQIQGDGGKQ